MARNISFPNPSFAGLNLFLGNKESKKWHYSNTFIERNNNESISVRLYGTKIVTFYQNGDIKVNTGGYHTPTTYRRINSFLPVGRVYQKEGLLSKRR